MKMSIQTEVDKALWYLKADSKYVANCLCILLRAAPDDKTFAELELIMKNHGLMGYVELHNGCYIMK